MFETIITWLNTPAFTMFSAPTTWAELFGFLTGFLCVLTLSWRWLVTWPLGIANNLLWIVLFLNAGLFADSALQIVYIVLAVIGWIGWAKSKEGKPEVPVTLTSGRQWMVLGFLGIVGTGAMMLLLSHYTSSTVPFWDGLTTTISLLATWGQMFRKIESWVLWVIVDCVYVPLYIYKGLTLTAILYVGFMLLCVYGLIKWTQAYRHQHVDGSLPAHAASFAILDSTEPEEAPA